MKTNRHQQLKLQIAALKEQQSNELEALHIQLRETYQSLRPFNLLKSTLQETAASGDIKQLIYSNILGIASGYLAKRVIVGKPKNTFSKIFGVILQFVVANAVVKKTEPTTN